VSDRCPECGASAVDRGWNGNVLIHYCMLLSECGTNAFRTSDTGKWKWTGTPTIECLRRQRDQYIMALDCEREQSKRNALTGVSLMNDLRLATERAETAESCAETWKVLADNSDKQRAWAEADAEAGWAWADKLYRILDDIRRQIPTRRDAPQVIDAYAAAAAARGNQNKEGKHEVPQEAGGD